jgi:hypothetical protein
VAENLREAPRDSVADAFATEATPPVDPDAVRRSYLLHRARRKARIEHRRRSKRAGARFWLVLVVLLGVCVFLALTTWREVGRLFGL